MAQTMLTLPFQLQFHWLQLGPQLSDSDPKLLYRRLSVPTGYQYIIYDLQVDLQPAEKFRFQFDAYCIGFGAGEEFNLSHHLINNILLTP